jgi:hypothetical protein
VRKKRRRSAVASGPRAGTSCPAARGVKLRVSPASLNTDAPLVVADGLRVQLLGLGLNPDADARRACTAGEATFRARMRTR